MNSAPEPIPTEQDMQAYADGRLAAERQASVFAYLARRPAYDTLVALSAHAPASPGEGAAASVSFPLAPLVSPRFTPAPPAPLDTAPDLSAAGFRVADARRLEIWPFAGANAFVYRNAAGEPVVLVAPGPPDGGGRWQARRVGAARLLAWTSRAGRHIVIAGDARTRGLMRAADLLAGD